MRRSPHPNLERRPGSPGRGCPTICGSGAGRPGRRSGSWATWPECWPDILAADARVAADAAVTAVDGDRFVATLGRAPVPGGPGGATRGGRRPSGARGRRVAGPVAGPDAMGGRGSPGGWCGRPAAPVVVGESGRRLLRALVGAGRRWWGSSPRGAGVWAVCSPTCGVRPVNRPTEIVFAEVGRPSRATLPTGARRAWCWSAASTGWTWPGKRRAGRRSGPGGRARWDHRHAGHRPGGVGREPLDPLRGTCCRADRSIPRRGRSCCAGPARRRPWHRAAPGRSTPWWPGCHGERMEDGPDDRTAPMSGVHLFVPMLHRHDAVGEHTLALRRPAGGRRGGLGHLHRDARPGHRRPRPVPTSSTSRDAQPGDVLVYQFATQSVIAAWLATTARAGGHQLPQHHPAAVLRAAGTTGSPACRSPRSSSWPRSPRGRPGHRGVSTSTSDELREAGCVRTVVIPVANVAVPPVEPDPAALERHRRRATRDPGHRWLSVGRLAPNKAHQHTIAALFVARATIDPGPG